MNVPAVGKVRVALVLAFAPGMSAGAPEAASKKTLCSTAPNANVTVPPVATVAGDGSKAMLGVALTVSVAGGVCGVAGAVVLEDAQAARRPRPIQRRLRSMGVEARGGNEALMPTVSFVIQTGRVPHLFPFSVPALLPGHSARLLSVHSRPNVER